MIDHDRLRRLIGGDDLAWLVERVRRRMARGEPLDGSVTLTGASQAQRDAVGRLLGRAARPGASLSVSLPAVDEVVLRSGACPGGLGVAVVALTGEVVDRAVASAELDRRWQDAFAPLDAAVAARPALTEWSQRLRSTGTVRRTAGSPEAAAELLHGLAEVVRHLPADGQPLGRFAADLLGSAHALDDDRPLTALVLSAARMLAGLPEGTGAEWRREAWAAVGLLRDDLSSTVLTVGLPGDVRTATGRALAAWYDVGQPVVLTLRQLVRDPPELRATDVFICENPVVVAAAADRLARVGTPLICTRGQPGAAVLHVARRLAAAGARLRYHGDFDWGGLRIANVVFDRVAAEPWRFRADDYRAALARGGRTLTGAPASADWDGRLGAAMTSAGRAVEEELVVDDLLSDLA